MEIGVRLGANPRSWIVVVLFYLFVCWDEVLMIVKGS